MRSTGDPACAQLRLCACFLFLWLFGAGVSRGEAPEAFPGLWSRVEELELWDDPEWWTLGHYHRTMWLRVESRIDDPRFFLHPKGKTNRKAELKATLKAFLREPGPSMEGDEEVRSVMCRFPARRRWLLERLEVPSEAFPAGDCEDYHRVRDQLEIDSAAVIYPSAYLNSPASMFGHLLLVLDREDKDRLLSRAVNYAAVVGDSFGPLFAFKGIFGLYDGVFAVLPYYDKVEEYSAVNRRDIWEYPLDLSERELDLLLRHVWELQELRSRYFFFKENCAFNLLYPIEAARPSLRITRRFRMSAVPVSLLQDLTETGITGEPVFRPSKTTRMRHLADLLSEDQRAHALALARGAAELTGEEDAVTVTLAQELTQYLYTEKRIDPETYRTRVFPLLRARSKMGKVELPPVPRPLPPNAGHAPRRLDVYAGVAHGEGGFGGVRLRSAYHDWLDDPRGYPPGSAITMFSVDARSRAGSDAVDLREFTLVDIRSLSPPEPWVRPISWTGSLRLEADPLDPGHHRTLGNLGTGIALEVGEGGRAYVMASQTVRWDGKLEDHVAWEPGIQWGLQGGGARLRAGVRGAHHFGVWGADGERHEIRAEARMSLTGNQSLGLAFSHRQERGEGIEESFLSFLSTF